MPPYPATPTASQAILFDVVVDWSSAPVERSWPIGSCCRRRFFRIAVAAFSGTFEYRVGERRDVRVNASQIADDAKEIAVVDAAGDRACSVPAPLQRPQAICKRKSRRSDSPSAFSTNLRI